MKNILELNNQKIYKLISYVAFCILNACLLIRLVSCNYIQFESGDDKYFYLIYSGVWGDYSPYVYYQNSIWGYFMCGLYKYFPVCNWYMIIMFALTALTYSIISGILINKGGAIKGFIMSSIVLLSTYEHLYMNFNYTQLAAWFSFVGLFLLMYKIHNKNKMSFLSIIVAGIMVYVGSLLRFKAFLLVLPFIICLVDYATLFEAVKSNAIKKTIPIFLKKMWPLITIFMVILLSYFYNEYKFKTIDEWHFFVNVTEPRTEFWDYYALRNCDKKEVILELGLSENDFKMFDNYCLSDEKIFSLDFWDKLSGYYCKESISISSIKKAVQNVYFTNNDGKHNYFWYAFILSTIAICMGSSSSILAFLICFAEVFWLVFVGRYPDRVYVIPYFSLIIISAYNCIICNKEQSIMKRDISLVFLLSYLLVCTNVLNIHHRPSDIDDSGSLHDIFRNNKDTVYVLGAFPINTFSLLDCPEKGIFENVVVRIDYAAQYPHNKNVLERRGYNNNIYEAMINNENILFVGEQYIEETKNFINEHYNENVDYKLQGEYFYSFYDRTIEE